MANPIIVVASVLKPVDDVRLYEKFALSLSQTNKYDIKIIGFSTKNTPSQSNIKYYPIFKFKRLSIHRVVAPINYWICLRKLQPDLIIVTTAELLPVSCIYKMLFRCKVIYDVQENHYKNIIYNNHYPFLFKWFLAFMVRGSESIFKNSVDYIIYAERCYEQELGFTSKIFSVLENKYKPIKSASVGKSASIRNFLYSGTISENYGIFEAIAVFRSLYELDDKLHLTIIGHCSYKPTLIKLKNLVKESKNIQLVSGEEPVAHDQIVDQILHSDLGIIAYRSNPSTKNCIPTRMYEYLALQLPMIIPHNPAWEKICIHYKAAISIDFLNNHPAELMETINQYDFYPQGIDDQVVWKKEEHQLLEIIDSVLS